MHFSQLPNLSIPFALLYQLRTRTSGKTTATGRLVFWLVVGELDRKPERELGKLEEMRKREAFEVHTAVDEAGSIHDIVRGCVVGRAASDGRSAVNAIVIGEQGQCRVSGGHKRNVSQGVDDRFRTLRAADGCIRKRLDGRRIYANIEVEVW